METRKPVILITEPTDYSKAALAVYESLGTVVLGSDDHTRLMQQLSMATIAVVRLHIQFNAAVLKTFGTKLTCIVSPTTGLDHIDTTFAQSQNIQLISLQGETDFLESIPSTAEFTMSLMLAASRKIITAHSNTMQGHWNRDAFKGHNLRGKTLGIIGLGRVGKQVAHLAHAFGMHIVAYDVQQKKECSTYINMQTTVDELVEISDIISIHIPSANNDGFIDANIVHASKPGAIWINTSRASIWNEAAIVAAVQNGIIGGVATDVLSHENEGDALSANPLWIEAQQNSRIIITPHLAGATYESMETTELFVAEKCKIHFQKK